MKLDEIKNLIENGDIVKADAELKAIVGREPDNTQAKLLYGTCRLLLGDENVSFERITQSKEYLTAQISNRPAYESKQHQPL